jgi:hypothetical protein
VQGTLATVARWLEENVSRLGLVQIRYEVIENPAKLHAGYERSNFLISVTAWEQGACLDVEILDKTTRAIEIVVQGPCKSQVDVIERLNAFASCLTESARALSR